VPVLRTSDNPATDIAMGASLALIEILARVRETSGSEESTDGSSGERMQHSFLRKWDLLAANLLSYAGGQVLDPERVEVLPFLCSFADLLRHTLDESVVVSVEVDQECFPWNVDYEALWEALVQLAANASRAMPEAGRLLLQASVNKSSSARETVFSMTDNGAGMSAAEMQMALTPFFTTKPNSPQSGMGLPGVMGFSVQSGGRMSISSRVGIGTTVTLTLPSVERGGVPDIGTGVSSSEVKSTSSPLDEPTTSGPQSRNGLQRDSRAST